MKRNKRMGIVDVIGDLLFPIRCPVCDKPVPYHRLKTGICTDCYKKIPIIGEHACYKCGRQLTDERKEWCEDCVKRRHGHYYEQGMVLCSYDDVMRESIYRLKYAQRKEYATVYGRYMARRFGSVLRSLGANSIVPVPLHPKRQRERGYNQAAVLAETIGRACGIPVYTDYISRVRNTPPLKSMTPDQRQNNLKKAFKIRRNDVKLGVTIVIDDIYTTGSTIDAIAEVLMEAGALRVYFMTLAIGEDD